jgi:hypothetical protein
MRFINKQFEINVSKRKYKKCPDIQGIFIFQATGRTLNLAFYSYQNGQ